MYGPNSKYLLQRRVGYSVAMEPRLKPVEIDPYSKYKIIYPTLGIQLTAACLWVEYMCVCVLSRSRRVLVASRRASTNPVLCSYSKILTTYIYAHKTQDDTDLSTIIGEETLTRAKYI